MSQKQNHWYPRYVGDYSKKTAELSLIEHGAYALLLDHYYATEKALPANASILHRICRAFASDEQEAVQSILDRFFTIEPDGWHNKRVDEELAKRIDISGKRRDSAQKMHEKKNQKKYANAHAIAPANADTPTPTPTYKLARDVKVFSEKEVNKAKKGEEAYTPMAYDGEILPGGWQDIAEGRNIPNSQIFASWRKFKETANCSVLDLPRWKAWVSRERSSTREELN